MPHEVEGLCPAARQLRASARARDVRRIFTTEGVALAFAGWLLGIPLGYALTRLIVWLVWEVVEVRVPARIKLVRHAHGATLCGV